MIYLDTSVVVPLYWPEALTNTVEALLINEPELGLSDLVRVEFSSAIARRVRMGEISRESAREIVEQFQAHIDAELYTLIAVEPIHYRIARGWIDGFETALRTLDALHLAIAYSQDIRLVTADAGLADSAVVLGVAVQLLEAT
ncbi:MAG: type II toxin-antitoxin system VapC family toxin [Cyanobacteriota bacterium]|nr:type II toxin-antitoxin system VapC family toxin [Cyanobacteriota bacterium]